MVLLLPIVSASRSSIVSLSFDFELSSPNTLSRPAPLFVLLLLTSIAQSVSCVKAVRYILGEQPLLLGDGSLARRESCSRGNAVNTHVSEGKAGPHRFL